MISYWYNFKLVPAYPIIIYPMFQILDKLNLSLIQDNIDNIFR